MVGELVGGGALQQQRRGADAKREHDQPAEPEGERQRRGTGEDVVGAWFEDVRGERVGVDQHVAVEVRRRLGTARGAGGEAEEGHVVGRGVDRCEVARLGGGGCCQSPLGAVVDDAHPGHGGRLEVSR